MKTKTFKRRESTIQFEAQEMSQYDFLMASPTNKINGARLAGHRPGFRISSEDEPDRWEPREQFLKNFVEVE